MYGKFFTSSHISLTSRGAWESYTDLASSDTSPIAGCGGSRLSSKNSSRELRPPRRRKRTPSAPSTVGRRILSRPTAGPHAPSCLGGVRKPHVGSPRLCPAGCAEDVEHFLTLPLMCVCLTLPLMCVWGLVPDGFATAPRCFCGYLPRN